MKERIYITNMAKSLLMSAALVSLVACQSIYQAPDNIGQNTDQNTAKAASISRGTSVAPGTKVSGGAAPSVGNRFVVPTPPAANPRNNSTYLPEISDEDLDIGAWETVSTAVPAPVSGEVMVAGSSIGAGVVPSRTVEDLYEVLDQVQQGTANTANGPSNLPPKPMSASPAGHIANDDTQYVTADGNPYPGTDLWEAKQQNQPLNSSATPVSSGEYAVHIASYRQEVNIRRGWDEVRRDYSSLLGGLQPIYSQKHIQNRGTFLRLKAGPFSSRAAASQACAVLHNNGDFCAVVRFEGVPL